MLGVADIPLEVGIQQGISLVDGGMELDPVGVDLDIVDSGGFQPVPN